MGPLKGRAVSPGFSRGDGAVKCLEALHTRPLRGSRARRGQGFMCKERGGWRRGGMPMDPSSQRGVPMPWGPDKAESAEAAGGRLSDAPIRVDNHRSGAPSRIQPPLIDHDILLILGFDLLLPHPSISAENRRGPGPHAATKPALGGGGRGAVGGLVAAEVEAPSDHGQQPVAGRSSGHLHDGPGRGPGMWRGCMHMSKSRFLRQQCSAPQPCIQ